MRTLDTLRLALEPQTAAHAEALFAVLVDPSLCAHKNEPPASVASLRARFVRLEARPASPA